MSPASSAARRPAAGRGLLSIGQVLAKLTPEFPDLTPSKLRFLEEQQLVAPARTESGYRKFGPEDLDRLRLILTLQRDQYLPLKVIREVLADLDNGRQPTLPGGADVPSILGRGRRFTRLELIAETGATAPLVQEAVAAGFLPAAEPYHDDAVGLLKALVELRRSGIEPRHLRSMRVSADREAALIESAVQPLLRHRDPSARARATESAHELETRLAVVRTAALRQALGGLGL